MKAIIPVAGAGTRLRPLTYTQPKPLIPVAGKPILSFIIDPLIEQGVTEYLIILGYLGDKIKAFVEEKYPHLSVSYIYQEERLGSAHALWIGRHFFNDADEVIIAFGDAIIDVDFSILAHESRSQLGDLRQGALGNTKDFFNLAGGLDLKRVFSQCLLDFAADNRFHFLSGCCACY